MLDRIYLILLVRFRRNIPGLSPESAHRRAINAVHGYIVSLCAAAVLLALIVSRALSGHGYSLSAKEIQIAQVAVVILIGFAIYRSERQLTRFMLSPPSIAADETESDRRFLNLVRLVAFGSVAVMIGLTILIRHLQS